MSEKGLWRSLQPILSSFGVAERIENRLGLGTPDVGYVLTWRGTTAEGRTELKHLDAFPCFPTTPVCVESLTKDQVLWHEAWAGAGGRVCTLLRIGRLIMALPPPLTRALYERKLTERALLREAAPRLALGLPVNRLMEWLTQ
jgi:hypothetical protein